MKKFNSRKSGLRLLVEGIADEMSSNDVNYNEDMRTFKESFISNMLENDRLQMGVGPMLERDVGRPFLVYGRYRQDSLVMDVKGLGMGNWDMFNYQNRAEELGINEDEYYQILRKLAEDIFHEWDEEWRHAYGVDLYALGRSGGYWGVDLDELVNKNYASIFTVNDKKCKELYRSTRKQNNDPYEQGYIACLGLNSDYDVAECFNFTPEFMSFMQRFKESILTTSKEWESREWNDTQFESYAND